MVLKPSAELRDEFLAVAALAGQLVAEQPLPTPDHVGKFLRVAVQIGDHEGFHADVIEARVDHQPPLLRPQLDIHLEMGVERRHLVIGPLDALTSRFAQTMGILLIGDIDPPAGLADPEQLLDDQLGPVEHQKRVAAGDEVELIVVQQHVGRVAEGEFDIADAELLGHLAGIGEAGLGMIHGHQARGLELLVEQHRKIADPAADVGDFEPGLQAVARQDVTLVAPGDLGLIAQDRNEAGVLRHRLAGIEVLVVLLDRDIGRQVVEQAESPGRPAEGAGGDDGDPEVGPLTRRI